MAHQADQSFISEMNGDHSLNYAACVQTVNRVRQSMQMHIDQASAKFSPPQVIPENATVITTEELLAQSAIDKKYSCNKCLEHQRYRLLDYSTWSINGRSVQLMETENLKDVMFMQLRTGIIPIERNLVVGLPELTISDNEENPVIPIADLELICYDPLNQSLAVGTTFISQSKNFDPHDVAKVGLALRLAMQAKIFNLCVQQSKPNSEQTTIRSAYIFGYSFKDSSSTVIRLDLERLEDAIPNSIREAALDGGCPVPAPRMVRLFDCMLNGKETKMLENFDRRSYYAPMPLLKLNGKPVQWPVANNKYQLGHNRRRSLSVPPKPTGSFQCHEEQEKEKEMSSRLLIEI